MANRTLENKKLYGAFWDRFNKYVAEFEPEFQIEFSQSLRRLPDEQNLYLKVRGCDSGRCRIVFSLAIKRRPFHVAAGIDVERDKTLYQEMVANRQWIAESLNLVLQTRKPYKTVGHLYDQREVFNPHDRLEERELFHWFCMQALKLRLVIVKFAWK